MQSRYYDPQVKRFINADDVSVLEEDQGSIIENNLFAYCLNNPVSKEDSEGEATANIIGAALGGVAGAALGCVLAKKLKLKGWKKAALISAAAVGGAVLGAFLGPYVAKLGKRIGTAVKALINAGKNSSKILSKIIKGAKETTRKKGKARNFEKSGGYKKALKDFKKFKAKKVEDISTKYGNGKYAELDDGTTISVRPGSKTGGATLEIKIPGQRLIKIRY